MKNNKIYIIILLTIFFFTSCSEGENTDTSDNCNIISCENDGILSENCNCECNEGFIGSKCENYDPNFIQKLLNNGVSIKKLLNGGIALDSLYGKKVNNGYVFLIDEDLQFFKIAASIDADNKMNWFDAIDYCTNLELDNITNWELPSLGDLYLIQEFLYQKGTGNFFTDFYWSSTEENSNEAYAIFFLNANEGIIPKEDSNGFSINNLRAVTKIDL